MDRITTNPNEILNIPEEDFPLMVLSDNLRSLFAWGIRFHQKGSYNHFMWAINPEEFVSQDVILHRVPIKKYLKGKHRLKFIRGKWNIVKKNIVKSTLEDALSKPFFKKLYDPLQIIGIAIGLKWLQIPGYSRICSDYGFVLEKVDPEYNLKHPSPTEINQYTKAHQDKYEVYLRFIPD